MKPLFIAIGLIIAIAALITSLNRWTEQLRQPTDLDYARASAEISRLSRQRESEETWEPIRAAAVNIAAIICILSIATSAGAWAVTAVIRFYRERMPNHAGLLPVRAIDLAHVSPQALGAFHAAKQLAASHAPVPATISYAPHTTYSPHSALDYRADTHGAPGMPTPVAVTGEHLPGLTDFADLGFVPSVERILLGLGPGGTQITVPMKSLWHIGLAGPTGNGKSNIARLVVAQLQAIGAKVCVGDPKWTEYDAEQDEDWRPIARKLAREPAYDAKRIGALLAWAAAPTTGELARRLDLRRRGEKCGAPVFIYLDELPWIADHVPNANTLIGELVRVGRGVGLFLLVGTQDMLAKTIDLSAERDNFRTGFYLGGDTTTGAILLGIPKREVCDPSGVGVAWLRSTATTPPQQVRVPYASNRAIAGLLGASAAPSAAPSGQRPVGFHIPTREGRAEGSTEGVTGAPLPPQQDAAYWTPEDARIVAALASGKKPGELAEELSGAKGGRKYLAAAEQIAAVIARLAARLGARELGAC